MNGVDLERVTDRELFVYLLFGSIPRRGWEGRNRYIARQLAITVLEVAGGIAFIAMLLLYILVLTPGPKA